VDPESIRKFDTLLGLRGKIMQAVEAAQKAKTIGGTLEAKVVVRVAAKDEVEVVREYREELDEIFVISDLDLEESESFSIEISRTPNPRCDRCWRYREDVGGNPAHPMLCVRCADAVTEAAIQAG
jgi:isoleucyl-tRNA synthetase